MAKKKSKPKNKPRAKRKVKNKKHSLVYYINIIILVLSITLVIFLIFKINTTSQKQIPITKNKQIEFLKDIQYKTEHEKFEEKTKALEIEYVDEDPIVEIPNIEEPKHQFVFEDKNITIPKKEPKIIPDKNITKIIKPKIKPIKKNTIKKDTRPMLAILIDDVTTKFQVKKIQDIGYNVTMSFLPPTKIHKYSAKIAKPFNMYMIHLPLEATTRRYEETNTLHIGDSIEKIDKRIKYLTKIYPKAKYINNHTGSKFTADKKSMDKLLKILKKYNYIFVDSRTTAKTKTKEFAKKHKIRYLSRNIFLDNNQNKKYIQSQLKKAIKIAKLKGKAIAIGHPHGITLKTLKESKHLLKGLNLVYINKL